MLTLLLPLLAAPPALQDESDAPDSDGPPIVAIDGDERQRYVLHAPPADVEPPEEGWRLLVVIPGGAGGPDFAPFVGRIREHALDDAWLVAQMIAPAWSDEQAEQNVWPTRRNPWPKMDFGCEELFGRVVDHVAEERELDPRYLFTLAWSSGGPLAYTLALAEESRVTGSFIAMSVYRPKILPSTRHAKGRRFHLYHSPDDWIPIAHAEKARDALEEEKAKVRLATYAGGHGWHGDVFGDLRAGLAWLAEEAAEAKPPRRRR